MLVAITGSSGFLGGELAAQLERGGHEVLRVRRGEPDDPRAHWQPASGWFRDGALQGTDAVVHLSGASIAAARWSPARREVLWRSRVDSTRTAGRAPRDAGSEALGPGQLLRDRLLRRRGRRRADRGGAAGDGLPRRPLRGVGDGGAAGRRPRHARRAVEDGRGRRDSRVPGPAGARLPVRAGRHARERTAVDAVGEPHRPSGRLRARPHRREDGRRAERRGSPDHQRRFHAGPGARRQAARGDAAADARAQAAVRPRARRRGAAGEPAGGARTPPGARLRARAAAGSRPRCWRRSAGRRPRRRRPLRAPGGARGGRRPRYRSAPTSRSRRSVASRSSRRLRSMSSGRRSAMLGRSAELGTPATRGYSNVCSA